MISDNQREQGVVRSVEARDKARRIEVGICQSHAHILCIIMRKLKDTLDNQGGPCGISCCMS